MALRPYYIGSVGPLEFDDSDLYPDGQPHSYFRVEENAGANKVWICDLFGRGSWATVPSGGAPAAHATTHQSGGSDPLNVELIAGVLALSQFNSGTGATANTVWHGDRTWSSIALADMANVASGTIFYRTTAGVGIPEVQTLATLKTDLGLTGTNSGDQTITLTGNVTGSGTGSFATTIAAGVVTLAMMANMATSSLIYRKSALSGVPEVNTLATLKTDLGLTGTNSGDQTITLTGEVTGSGTGSFATTLVTTAVTGNKTWAAGGAASIAWTFDLSGTDPVWTAVSGGFTSSGTFGCTALSATTGGFTGNVTITLASAMVSFVPSDAISSIQMNPASGAALLRIDPKAADVASTSEVAFFRVTNSTVSGYPKITIYKGNNSSSVDFQFACGTSPELDFYDGSGNLASLINVGLIRAGKATTVRGQFESRRGTSTNTPGTLMLESRSGTSYYFWATDAGALRHHTSLPTADTDGANVPSATKSFILTVAGGTPATTSGCSPAVQRETTTNKINYFSADFADGANSSMCWAFQLPYDYNAGTLSCTFVWETTSGSGTVIWGIKAIDVGDNVATDTAYGTAATATDTIQNTNRVHISPAATLTIGGTPLGGDMCFFEVYRDVTDTCATTVRLLCVRCEYTPLVL